MPVYPAMTLDDISDTQRVSTCPPRTQTAAESVISSRKAWKTIKSQNEAVWPPAVEAALIAGLEKYRPKSVKDVSLLKRFPKRNSWISNYIKHTTGRDRSPKQVGSRLQQLRDTCTDERIHRLLFRREYSPDSETNNGSEHSPCTEMASTLSSPVSSPSDSATSEYSTTSDIFSVSSMPSVSRAPTLRRNSPTATSSHTTVSIELISSSRNFHGPTSASGDSQFFPIIRTDCGRISLLASHPSSWLREPSISFTSHTLLSRQSSMYRVFVGGTLVHSDWTSLVFLSTERLVSYNGSKPGLVYHYQTSFIPSFWKRMRRNFNLSQYTVSQYIAEREPMECLPSEASPGPPTRVVHTITYQFNVRQVAAPSGSGPSDVSSHSENFPRDYAPILRRTASSGTTRSTLELTQAPVKPNHARALDALGLDDPSYSTEPAGRAHYPIPASLPEEEEHPLVSSMHSEDNPFDESRTAQAFHNLQSNASGSCAQHETSYQRTTVLSSRFHHLVSANTALSMRQNMDNAGFEGFNSSDGISNDCLPVHASASGVVVPNAEDPNAGTIERLLEAPLHHHSTTQSGHPTYNMVTPTSSLRTSNNYPDHYPPLSSEWNQQPLWPFTISSTSSSCPSPHEEIFSGGTEDHPRAFSNHDQQVYDSGAQWVSEDSFNQNIRAQAHTHATYVFPSSSTLSRFQRQESSGTFDFSSDPVYVPPYPLQPASGVAHQMAGMTGTCGFHGQRVSCESDEDFYMAHEQHHLHAECVPMRGGFNDSEDQSLVLTHGRTSSAASAFGPRHVHDVRQHFVLDGSDVTSETHMRMG